MKTPIEIRLSPCPAQAPRRLACKISPPYAAPLSSSSRAHVMTQVAYLVDFNRLALTDFLVRCFQLVVYNFMPLIFYGECRFSKSTN